MGQPPVIVVPGITATQLDDYYPVEPEVVWTEVKHKDFDRVAMHPDDLRFEAAQPARVTPKNAFGIVYGDLIEALRHDLTKKSDKPVPVFGFGYDWRQDCNRSAKELEAFVEEVLARTAILPHYADAPPKVLDLVGHSSGGLIIAKYLKNRQDAKQPSKVRRVVTMGTAFHGSVDSLLKLATGMGSLTGPEPRDRERESARTIPHLYQLLPTYRGAVTADAGLSTDLFDLETWQPSLLQTLGEYIRLKKAKVTKEQLLKTLLDTAKAFIDAVNGLEPAKALPEKKDGWLPIVGLGEDTHLEAHIGKGKWFEFPDPVNEPAPSERTGDGTVPFPGARPDFLEPGRLVGVTAKELGFFELKDRVLVSLAGLHGFLPKVNLVQRLAIKFLRDDFSADFEARRAPGVAKTIWPSWLKEKK